MTSRLHDDTSSRGSDSAPFIAGASDLLKPRSTAAEPSTLVTPVPRRPTPPAVPTLAGPGFPPAPARAARAGTRREARRRGGDGDCDGDDSITQPIEIPAPPRTPAPERSERRRERRLPFDESIEIWQRDASGRADRFKAWGLNISQGGMRIIYTGFLEAGERIGVQLRKDRVAMPARVAWVKPQQDGCIAGVTFAS